MICLIGESASGKSTIEKELVKNYGYKKVISYTTRQPRIGEEDGIDYHFISNEEFNSMVSIGYMAEHATYNGWQYGIARCDCKDERVAVVTPHGLRMLKRFNDLNIQSFYINVPRRDRLIKILQRLDNIEEAYRRNLSDVGMYDGVEDEVSHVIYNAGYTKSPKELCEEILNEIK